MTKRKLTREDRDWLAQVLDTADDETAGYISGTFQDYMENLLHDLDVADDEIANLRAEMTDLNTEIDSMYSRGYQDGQRDGYEEGLNDCGRDGFDY